MAVGPATELSIIVKFLGQGLASLSLAADGLKKLVDLGIDYNKENEASQIGITGLITSLSQLTDAQGNVLEGQEKFNAAAALASDQLEKLKKDSLLTAATFPELRDAFQQAIAPGLEAGMNFDQIRKFVIDATQGASALGLATEQIAQETSAILRGDIDVNARLAKSLGITNQMVNDWKAQGTLVEELTKRMQGFAQMGEATAKSWAGVTSNFEELLQRFSGESTKGLFDNLKTSLNDALSGTIDASTGKLNKDIQAIAERFNDLFSVIGQDLGSVLTFVIDKTKEFGRYLDENRETVDKMSGSFDAVWEAVKSVVKALLDIPSLDGTKENVDAISEGFGGLALVIAGVADGIKTIEMGLKYVGASANEFLGTIYDSYAAIDRFTGNLKNAAIDKEIAASYHQSALSMKKDADDIWDSFAKGESNVQRINRQLEELGKKGKESAQSTKEGMESASKAIDKFYESSIDATQGVIDLNKLSKDASKTLEDLFSKGQISQKDYQEGIDKINERLKQLGSDSKVAVKGIEDIKKELATVSKKPIEDVSQAFQELGVQLTKVNADKQLESWKLIDSQFNQFDGTIRKSTVGLQSYQKATLAYLETQIKMAAESGKTVDANLKEIAAKAGLSESFKKLIEQYKTVNPEIESYLSNSVLIVDNLQREIAAINDKYEVSKNQIEQEIKLAGLQGDKVRVAELTVKAAKEEVQSIKDRIQAQEKYVENLRLQLKQVEQLADVDGERTQAEKERVNQLKDLVREESNKLAIDRASLPVAEKQLQITENINGKAQAYIKVLRELNRYELELSQTRQSVLSNMEQLAELNLQLAESSGDLLKVERAQSELNEAKDASNRASLKILSDKVQLSKDEYAQTLEQATADGALNLEELKLLETKQESLNLAQSDLATQDELIEKRKELAAAQKKLAEETKKAEEAEREHAAQLKAQGDFVSNILTGWQKRLTALSDESYNAYLKMRGATAGYINDTEDAAGKIEQISEQITDLYRNMDYGFVKWANTVALQALTVEKAFWGQVDAANALSERLKQTDGDTARSVGNLTNLIREAESTRDNLNLLDKTRLDNLNQAIESAKNKMEELKNASIDALDAAQRALLQEQGNQKKLLELDFEQKKLELTNKINEARNAGDQEALRNLQKALELEKQTYDIKQKKLKESTNTTSTTSPSQPSGGNTNITYNINADVSSLATEDFWRRKVIPISDKVSKLRG